MSSVGTPIRGKILFRWDQAHHRFILRWCHVQVKDAMRTMRSWGPLSTEFPNELETIAYGKNLILKHLTEGGLADAVDNVEWWIKGDDTYYCPGCLSPLAHEAKEKRIAIPPDHLYLTCDQCHRTVHIPAAAFSFAPH
jgi:hypothetical protein